MRFWIKKENDQDPHVDWKDAYVFSVNRDTGSTLYSSLPTVWYHLNQIVLNPLYEDLYIIALSAFGIDKRVSRRLFDDCWTRDISVSIPVLEYDSWKKTESDWNKMLTFLTGDRWKISFRPTDAVCSRHEHKNRKKIDISKCNCVSLFSGGLDSFCGAIHLMQSGLSPCLVGHNEYPKLRYKQEKFCQNFRDCFPAQHAVFVGFTAGSRAPYSLHGSLPGTENTSRGRSLLFLSAALSVAGIMGENTPVYIPENGFIGLNVALTGSRKGSCSTRTTHPYFLRQLKDILTVVGIKNPINNIFAFQSKREIVRSVKDCDAFQRGYKETISCSHPCVSRYNRSGSREYPINCGYCYPCIIRKSSLLDVSDEGYSHMESPSKFLDDYSESDKSADLNAVVSSIYRFQTSNDEQLRRLIRKTGSLSQYETEQFLRLYKSSMNDIIELFRMDPGMERYIKWDIS